MPLSAANVRYVQSLDGRADALMLRAALGERLRPSCLLTLRVCTALLQEVRRGQGATAIGLPLLAHAQLGLPRCPVWFVWRPAWLA